MFVFTFPTDTNNTKNGKYLRNHTNNVDGDIVKCLK